MDAKEYIKNKILEYDSSIDTSAGSPFGDLFINPLSVILQESFDFEDHMLDNLSLANPENMTEDELDAIAANYLLTRYPGSKASGNIRLYYNLPVSIAVPAGTVFSNDAGNTYVTASNYAISSQAMTLNSENFPLYHSGNIPIEGSAEGEDYISMANTVTTLISTLEPIPSSIRNPIAISAGTDKETNTALAARILTSVNNQSIASPDGIKRVLQETYPTITSLTVKGNGDTEMIRDLTYSGVELNNVYTTNFDAKISGLYVYPYNESIAYAGKFKDTDISTVIELPDPADFTFEFTNDMYKGLYKNDDALYAELGVYNVLIENFNNVDTSTGYNINWVSSDGQTGKGILADPNEIKIDSQAIKFGVNNIDAGDGTLNPTGPTVTIDVNNYNSLVTDLNKVQTGTLGQDVLSGFLQGLQDLTAPEVRNNFAPVFQIPIDQHSGVMIEGSFKTNDENGNMSYITLKRDRDIAVPFDGYGISWRVGDGSDYNVYIVDNDALTSEVFINEEQLWDQTGGTNQFLATAATEILKDVWYDFVIKIYEYNGMDVWVYRQDTPVALTPANRIVFRGQTYPAYITQSAGDHFGLGVIETQNHEWWYKNLKISNIVESYPMHLFKLKAKEANFPTGDPFSLEYYGVGWGDTVDSLKFYARNIDTDTWDLMETSTVANDVTIPEMRLTKSLTNIDTYRDASEYINILATPYNFLDDEHELRSYYVGAVNTLLSGVHRGNMTDIYIEDKSRITTATQSVVMGGVELLFRTNSSFTLPIVDIIAVSRTLTGALYIENTDYTITRPNEGKSYSTIDDIKIVFSDPGIAGISVDIQYRYYQDGASVQTLLNSDEYRYPGTDNLAKIKPLTIVNIERFDYRGPVAFEIIQNALIAFINDISDGSLEISDLVNTAYTAGATFVDLTTIDISVKDHGYLGTYVANDVTNTYTLSSITLKEYYCDTVSAVGVTKLT